MKHIREQSSFTLESVVLNMINFATPVVAKTFTGILWELAESLQMSLVALKFCRPPLFWAPSHFACTQLLSPSYLHCLLV